MGITEKYKPLILETRRIRLREILERDLATIFQWRNTDKFRFLFHYCEDKISYDGFFEEFTGDLVARPYQFIIEKKDSKEAVGLTFIHTYSEEDKYCFLNLFLSEPFEKRGYGVDAFVLFSLYLFLHVGIKKLFVDASDYNHHSLACIRNMGMRELVGIVTKKVHEGVEHDILRFVGDDRLLPRLTKIHQHLTDSTACQKNHYIDTSPIF